MTYLDVANMGQFKLDGDNMESGPIKSRENHSVDIQAKTPAFLTSGTKVKG
ncbi:hypothetical protein [Tatumella ptyseos]|uniref:hypothetical protein n=1 Tax=Tatumella ptyseos TaxID=82987 RepID=UPI0026EB56E2|nr:hypothetical protein [Tatumella ptyseos]WKX26396.1 hypothetical protein QJR74_14220 [Tatumella ptyseos]